LHLHFLALTLNANTFSVSPPGWSIPGTRLCTVTLIDTLTAGHGAQNPPEKPNPAPNSPTDNDV